MTFRNSVPCCLPMTLGIDDGVHDRDGRQTAASLRLKGRQRPRHNEHSAGAAIDEQLTVCVSN